MIAAVAQAALARHGLQGIGAHLAWRPAGWGSYVDDRRLIDLTVDDLRAIVREEVAALRGRATVPAAEWLTAEQVASLVGYRRSYIPELVRRHDLPAHQPNGRGGRLMFRRDEVEAWVAQRGGKR